MSTCYSCQILMELEFVTDFQKILKYQISRKSTQWEQSCSMQTDMTKLIFAFCNFSNKPKQITMSQSPFRNIRSFHTVYYATCINDVPLYKLQNNICNPPRKKEVTRRMEKLHTTNFTICPLHLTLLGKLKDGQNMYHQWKLRILLTELQGKRPLGKQTQTGR